MPLHITINILNILFKIFQEENFDFMVVLFKLFSIAINNLESIQRNVVAFENYTIVINKWIITKLYSKSPC